MPFRILVLLGVEIGLAIGSLVQPYWGLLVLLFLTFARPQDDRPNMTELHIPFVLTATTAFGTLWRLPKAHALIFRTARRLILYMILYGLFLISAMANNWTDNSKTLVSELATVFIVCTMLLMWAGKKLNLHLFFYTLCAAGLYLAKLAITQPSFMRESIGGEVYDRLRFRFNSTMGNPNYMAQFMVILILIGLCVLTSKHSVWIKLPLAGALGAFLYTFMLCQSRGATLALAGGLVVVWLVQPRKILSAGLMALVMIGFLAFAPEAYMNRMKTIGSYEQDKSATARLELWDIAIQLISDHPLLGIGPDNFVYYAPNSQHNAYLQMASEVGLPAMVIYILILLSGIVAAARARKIASRAGPRGSDIAALAGGAMATVVGIIIQGFFTGFAHREFVYVMVTFCFAVRHTADELRQKPEPAPAPQRMPRRPVMQPALAERRYSY